MKTNTLTAAVQDIATRAAFRRLSVLGWTPADVTHDAEALATAVCQALQETAHQALDDARAAMAAGMDEIAVQTFQASLVLAGIEAANRHHAATRPEAVPA